MISFWTIQIVDPLTISGMKLAFFVYFVLFVDFRVLNDFNTNYANKMLMLSLTIAHAQTLTITHESVRKQHILPYCNWNSCLSYSYMEHNVRKLHYWVSKPFTTRSSLLSYRDCANALGSLCLCCLLETKSSLLPWMSV